jgi:hypothetical protein
VGKHNIFRILGVLLCLLALSMAVSAAETGSIRVADIDEPICLHFVATPDGVLAEAFADAAVESLSESTAAVSNARILREYAVENQIRGSEGTPDDEGFVLFNGLEEGLYLVYSLAEEAEFNPFLVKIPTVINDEVIYDVEAARKEEEPPEQTTAPTEPDDPSDPTPPEEPDIPQTGISVYPKYILLFLGCAIIVLGVVDLILGKEKQL